MATIEVWQNNGKIEFCYGRNVIRTIYPMESAEKVVRVMTEICSYYNNVLGTECEFCVK